ncbi:hypothetical protein [Solibaculum mannosilyticum]|uniref:hypothetical protein n=1 Tax=Solibaculum mannosilyticum TaxID=2780922 RepID=UPI0036F3084F
MTNRQKMEGGIRLRILDLLTQWAMPADSKPDSIASSSSNFISGGFVKKTIKPLQKEM